VAAAGTSLDGNGPSPAALVRAERTAVFTHPDHAENRLVLLNAHGERRFTPALRLQALAYYRQSHGETRNGDQARWLRCQGEEGGTRVCARDEEGRALPVRDGAGLDVPWNDVHPWDAAQNETTTLQHGYGAAVQLAHEAPLVRRENHLFAGLALDEGRAAFSSRSLLARLSGTRGAEAIDAVDPTSPVGVHSVVRALGVYASDTFALLPALFLSVSGRFNLVGLTLDDEVGEALDGQHRFARLNPAAGISYQPTRALGGYLGYSESARAPTPLELTCADPAAPCRLPNAFASDPPLKQVVARTIELGGRGRVDTSALSVDYAVAVFRATNNDDIQFISAGLTTGQGYFANVGRTRRQGVEASVAGRHALRAGRGTVDWSLQYLFLQATFETAFVARSDHHPLAEDGALAVPAGSRLPGVPRHMAKVGVGWTRGRLALGAGLVANSGQYLRGDEANLLAPLPAYAVADLRGSFRLTAALTIFARVSNLFGARYSSFGVLGDAATVLGSDYDSPRFQSPGAPRAAWAGVDVGF
jgi:iron complex outermembrane receptor protein